MMTKRTKKWLIAAAALAAVGAIAFAAVMTAYHWDFSRLNTRRYETNTYEIREGFTGIDLHTETADILFVPSSDGTAKVVCLEEENCKHTVAVRDGTLTISVADDRAWYEHIGFDLRSPKVTVYLPKTEYASLVIRENTGNVTLPEGFTFGTVDVSLTTGDVETCASATGRMHVQTTTGDIRLQSVSCGELEMAVSTGSVDARAVSCEGSVGVKVSTGDARLTDLTCGLLRSEGSTGDFTLQNVVSKASINIRRSTGDVRLDSCDADELEITTDTGSITGSLLSPKVFIAHSDTGSVTVPETTSGGKCRITTDTGDIRITVG